MKKTKAILAGLALFFALMLGMAVPAFAEGEVVVNKTIQFNEGSYPVYDAEFVFNVEAIELETNVPGVMTFTDAPLPTISNITLTPGANTGASSVTFDAWPHAGTYAWKITEQPDTYYDEGEMQYDPQVYTLIADVKNAAQGGGYDVNYIIVKGEATSTEVDDTQKTSSIDFTNKFTRPTDVVQDLRIRKELDTGGDEYEQFAFTITFNIPEESVLPANKTAADVLNEITPDTNTGGTVTQATPAAPGDTSRVFHFTAAHNDEIVFRHLLGGMTYTISETPVAGYSQHWTAYNALSTLTTTDDILIATLDNVNLGVMINTYEVNPPTALILNNLPFILLGVLAVVGLVVYGVIKKRINR